MKELYSTDSIATIPIDDEFSKEERKRILKKINKAYSKIGTHIIEKKKKKKLISEHDKISEKKERSITISGSIIQQVREIQGISLLELSKITKISKQILEDIELENYEKLPPEVYLMCHITNYTKFLSIDSTKAANDYMKHYKKWKKKSKKEV
jgi:choline kinase